MRDRKKGVALRLWFHVHSWIGVTAGLMLFIIAWSGTMAVFSHEIDWALNPAIRAEGEVRSWSAIERAVRAAYPDALITAINAPFAPGFAAEVDLDSPRDNLMRVYVHPETARIQGATSFFNVQRFFRSFHMELFIGPGRLGIYIVSAFSLALLASMVTALVFYKRWWRGFFRLRGARGAKVLMSDLHKFAGVWNLAFVVIMVITGVWYFIEALDNDNRFFPRLREPASITRDGPVEALSLDDLVARTRALRPELEIRAVYPPAKPGDTAWMAGQGGHVLVRDGADRVILDTATGDVLRNQYVRNLPLYFRWVETADALHFGTFGGLISRILWLVFGVGLSALCLTGAYVQAQKQRRADRRWPRVAIVAAGAATGGVLILASLGAVEEITSFGPMFGRERFPDAPWGVWAFLSAWCASALAGIGFIVGQAR